MSEQGLTVLSLFDGMSCGAIALRESGIRVKQYFASEIDKSAIRQTRHNFPDTVHLGDVRNISAKDLPPVDLLIGGSPCQGFSFAGKQLNFKDPRSALFFEYVRILDEIRSYNPDVKFLFENVRMHTEYENIISEYLGLEPVAINSALLSAQNRFRLYWTNILTSSEPHIFGMTVRSAIPRPEDRNIYFCDVSEFEVDSRFYMTAKEIDRMVKQVAYGSGNSGYNPGNSLIEFSDDIDSFGISDLAKPSGFCPEHWIAKRRIRPSPEIARLPVTAIQGDRAILDCISDDESTIIIPGAVVSPLFGGGFRPILSGKAACLNATSGSSAACLIINGDDIVLRRMTPEECRRLQTVPDWYEWICSERQMYKLLGNGWTVDVIRHILQFL